jgi:hypothetical protein
VLQFFLDFRTLDGLLLPSGNRCVPSRGRSAMIHLIIAVALGIVLAVGGAFAASGALTGVANGSPAKASLYQYGNR